MPLLSSNPEIEDSVFRRRSVGIVVERLFSSQVKGAHLSKLLNLLLEYHSPMANLGCTDIFVTIAFYTWPFLLNIKKVLGIPGTTLVTPLERKCHYRYC